MSNGTDDEMMEAEFAEAPSIPVAPELNERSTDQNDVVRGLLTMARQLVEQSKPSQALQAVVIAMRTKGGDEAVLQALNRAREMYRNKIQENAAADKLASLFAECAIAEAMPSKSESSEHSMVNKSVEVDVNGTSILAETGRKQIVLDAVSDGSSFVCLQCGGLVSNDRKDEHYAFWCCKI